MKKFISIFLAIGFVISLCICPVRGAEVNYSEVQGLISALSIMQGDENGDFCLEDFVTRAEFSKIAVASSEYRNSVPEVSRISPFPDVPYTYWGAPYIKTAAENGFVKGYLDSTFRPEERVLLEEGVTIALKLLGYKDSDFGISWPMGQMKQADTLDLLKGIDKSVGDYMQRKDVCTLIYNTLSCNIKGTGNKAISAFGYNVLEDVVFVATTNEDKTLSRNKIITSAGTYNITANFNKEMVGLKGDLVLKSSEEAIAFLPENTKRGSYSVYTVLNDDILVYANGQTASLGVSADTVAYKGSEKGSVSSMLGKIKQGDSVSLYNNYLGEVEYIIVGSETLKGPFRVSSPSRLKEMYSISDDAVFMKDGRVVSFSEIAVNDIIYISNEMDLVWAYSLKVSGVYEKALPSKDNVTSIILSGITYEIESSDAFNKLVTGGMCELGDPITILLGKDGKIADVLTSKSEQITSYGYLTETGTKEFTSDKGNSYTSYYAVVADASGQNLTYKTNKDYKDFLSSIVSVSVSADGTRISRVNYSDNIEGTFNWQKKLFGNLALAGDVKIMDVMNLSVANSPSYTLIYPQRLDNLTISRNKVLWYTKNQKGEIDTLYVDDVTGDGYGYGLVQSVNGNSYTCDYNGSKVNVNGGNTTYSVSSGNPARFTLRGQSISAISSLFKVSERVVEFTKDYVLTSSKKYYVSDKVVCYKNNGAGVWQIVPLSDIEGKTASVEFYYDKEPSVGGKIRVIKCY